MLTPSDLRAIDKVLVKRVEPIDKRIRKVEKDIKTLINYSDKQMIYLQKRVERVEVELNLPPLALV